MTLGLKPRFAATGFGYIEVGNVVPGSAAGARNIVSGGLGKIKVSYKGQTYYVCCTGCQEAFKDDPEKYLKEYAERKAKEAKEKSR